MPRTIFGPQPPPLFFKLLALIFVVETGVMLLMEGLLNAFLAPGIRGIADASLLTVCTAPFLWWLVVLPLRRSALIERSKSDALQQQMVDAVVTCDARGVVGSLKRLGQRRSR